MRSTADPEVCRGRASQAAARSAILTTLVFGATSGYGVYLSVAERRAWEIALKMMGTSMGANFIQGFTTELSVLCSSRPAGCTQEEYKKAFKMGLNMAVFDIFYSIGFATFEAGRAKKPSEAISESGGESGSQSGGGGPKVVNLSQQIKAIAKSAWQMATRRGTGISLYATDVKSGTPVKVLRTKGNQVYVEHLGGQKKWVDRDSLGPIEAGEAIPNTGAMQASRDRIKQAGDTQVEDSRAYAQSRAREQKAAEQKTNALAQGREESRPDPKLVDEVTDLTLRADGVEGLGRGIDPAVRSQLPEAFGSLQPSKLAALRELLRSLLGQVKTKARTKLREKMDQWKKFVGEFNARACKCIAGCRLASSEGLPPWTPAAASSPDGRSLASSEDFMPYVVGWPSGVVGEVREWNGQCGRQ